MMPRIAATHFSDLLLFVCSALDYLGVEYVIHYGSLLGAARLGAPLPWDEDHDLFILDVDLARVRRHLTPIMTAHGFRVVPDPTGFLWIKDKHWPAGSGHLALDVLPPLVHRVEDVPNWEGGAPHLVASELRPLRPLTFYGSFVWAPAAFETVLARLYGASGSPEALARFAPPPIDSRSALFWASARSPGRSDWLAISETFRSRSRWRHLAAIPWWWLNGGYIVGVNALKRWARARRSA